MVGQSCLAPDNFVTIFTDDFFSLHKTLFTNLTLLCETLAFNITASSAAPLISMSLVLLLLSSSTPIGVLSSHLLEEGT